MNAAEVVADDIRRNGPLGAPREPPSRWLVVAVVACAVALAQTVFAVSSIVDTNRANSRARDWQGSYWSLVRSINKDCTWTADGHALCDVGAPLPTTSTTVKP